MSCVFLLPFSVCLSFFGHLEPAFLVFRPDAQCKVAILVGKRIKKDIKRESKE